MRTGLTGRENATMLFAAGVSVFADVVCLSKQVSVTIVIDRQNHSTPVIKYYGLNTKKSVSIRILTRRFGNS